MNRPDDALSKNLRELAAASPQGAPPELGARLSHAFARHHSRRRRRRIALVSVFSLCLLISLAWLRVSHPSHLNTKRAEAPRTLRPTPAAAANSAAPAPVVAHPPHRRARSERAVKPHVIASARPAVVANNDFVALPLFDPSIPIGQPRMVRLELPGSALQLIGYPVSEQLLERHVLTDVLVGQDGVPYAVRLVHATH